MIDHEFEIEGHPVKHNIYILYKIYRSWRATSNGTSTLLGRNHECRGRKP